MMTAGSAANDIVAGRANINAAKVVPRLRRANLLMAIPPVAMTVFLAKASVNSRRRAVPAVT
jgi:hypothetical protein